MQQEVEEQWLIVFGDADDAQGFSVDAAWFIGDWRWAFRVASSRDARARLKATLMTIGQKVGGFRSTFFNRQVGRTSRKVCPVYFQIGKKRRRYTFCEVQKEAGGDDVLNLKSVRNRTLKSEVINRRRR